MKWVIGFDLSLKNYAAVALPLDWRPGDWKRVKAWRVEGEKLPLADLIGHTKRYISIANWAVSCVKELGGGRAVKGAHAVEVYVESYGFNKNNALASRVMESGGHVKAELFRRYGSVMREVASSSARKLSLGFSPRKPMYNDAKAVIKDVVLKKFKGPKTWGDNECDAFLVAQFGLSEEGGTILTLAGAPLGKRRKNLS